MAFLAPIRDRLCYPAGYSPGIDPTHPAARRFLRLSVVATMGQNLIRLDKLPIKGTAVVGPAFTNGIHGVIGPFLGQSAANGKVTFAGNSVVAPTSCTLAGIFIATTAATQCFIINPTSTATAFPMLWADLVSTQSLHLGSSTGAPEIDSGIPIVAGVPYFAAASYAVNGAGFVNFVVTNLITGQIQFASVANTFASVASSGTYTVLTDGVADVGSINLATAMYSTAGLKPAELLAWARDPWAFWYPDIGWMDDFIVASTLIPPSPTPLGASLMPMMGVG